MDHGPETATDTEIRGCVLFQDIKTRWSLICLDKRKPINFKYSSELITRDILNMEQKCDHYLATFRWMTYDDDDDDDDDVNNNNNNNNNNNTEQSRRTWRSCGILKNTIPAFIPQDVKTTKKTARFEFSQRYWWRLQCSEITASTLVYRRQRFGGRSCLHLQESPRTLSLLYPSTWCHIPQYWDFRAQTPQLDQTHHWRSNIIVKR